MEPTREERVVIVGAGPAGLRAAEVLSGVGLRPILIDAGSAPGGRVRRLGRQGQARLGDRSVSLQRGFAGLAEKIEFRPETIATGIENGCLGVRRGEAVETLPFDALILATGASELLLPFPGWSRDGVATMSHALAALSRGRPVGRRPVFLGTGPMLYRAAARHAAAGTAPAAVLDTGPAGAGARALPRIATDWIQFGELVADVAALQDPADRHAAGRSGRSRWWEKAQSRRSTAATRRTRSSRFPPILSSSASAGGRRTGWRPWPAPSSTSMTTSAAGGSGRRIRAASRASRSISPGPPGARGPWCRWPRRAAPSPPSPR